MSIDFYFFDQYSRSSHFGGVHRTKKNIEDYHQALQYHKLAVSSDNEKNHHQQTTIDEAISQSNQNHSSPVLLTKELDSILQTFDHYSDTSSFETSETTDDENENPCQLPKVSLPASLILQLHSTWSDLIQNANYQYKVWQTKSAENSWKQFVQRKRFQQLNPSKIDEITETKLLNRRRTSSRVSITSISTNHTKSRLSRTFSRSSIFSTTHDNHLRLIKLLNSNSTDNINESTIKNGIHVEFKFSSQDQQIQQKIASFHVPKSNINIDEDIIHLVQNHCRRLLTETKQRIFETTSNEQLPKIWFYEDNQFVRKKNKNLLISNEFNRKQKSKFVLSILRSEIPDKFQFDWNFPEKKHKCYIELSDGSAQIYYPSGRLAVLRFCSMTLFYDDSSQNCFLGFVNSHDDILLMKPNSHARFLTNHQQECAYLCDGKSGFIEKQFSINQQNDKNLFQFQLNSFMQIEYENNFNIKFRFNYENHLFEYQLGKQRTTFQSVTSTILTTKKLSSNFKRSNSILSNQTDKQINIKQKLTSLQELDLLKKRIKHICHSWFKLCRSVLGIMNIDAYHLPDYPFESTKIEKRIPLNNDHLVKSFDREQYRETKSNTIANVIEQFIPHSDTGRAIKQRIYEKNLVQKSVLNN